MIRPPRYPSTSYAGYGDHYYNQEYAVQASGRTSPLNQITAVKSCLYAVLGSIENTVPPTADNSRTVPD